MNEGESPGLPVATAQTLASCYFFDPKVSSLLSFLYLSKPSFAFNEKDREKYVYSIFLKEEVFLT